MGALDGKPRLEDSVTRMSEDRKKDQDEGEARENKRDENGASVIQTIPDPSIDAQASSPLPPSPLALRPSAPSTKSIELWICCCSFV